MTAIRHPLTGVLINDIVIRRTGPIDADEMRTVSNMRANGDPWWLISAKMGRFPMAYAESTPNKPKSNKPSGNDLSARAANADPRQPNFLDDSPDQEVTPE